LPAFTGRFTPGRSPGWNAGTNRCATVYLFCLMISMQADILLFLMQIAYLHWNGLGRPVERGTLQ
jgi:hypothetical protein